MPVSKASSGHGLRCVLWIDTGPAELKQAPRPGRISLMDHIVLDHHVFIDELGWQKIVGMNAADFCRCQDHYVGLFVLREAAHGGRISEVQFRAGMRRDLKIPAPLKLSENGTANHSAMAGEKQAWSVHHTVPSDPAGNDHDHACCFNMAWRDESLRSASTIFAHISRAVICGSHPSCSRAFVGSPSSDSTSAGRK